MISYNPTYAYSGNFNWVQPNSPWATAERKSAKKTRRIERVVVFERVVEYICVVVYTFEYKLYYALCCIIYAVIFLRRLSDRPMTPSEGFEPFDEVKKKLFDFIKYKIDLNFKCYFVIKGDHFLHFKIFIEHLFSQKWLINCFDIELAPQSVASGPMFCPKCALQHSLCCCMFWKS